MINCINNVRHFWVLGLPDNLDSHSIYFVRTLTGVMTYVTDSHGVAFLIGGDSTSLTITSPDGSIDIVNTEGNFELQVAADLISRIKEFHNEFTDLQGGAPGEYYHLSESDYTALLDLVSRDYVESITGTLVDNTDPKNPIINIPDGFVPYIGATQDVDLGSRSLTSQSITGSILNRSTMNPLSQVVQEFDSGGSIEGRASVQTASGLAVSSSSNNGSIQSSISITVKNVIQPTIRTANQGLFIDVPTGKEFRYENNPTLVDDLSIPNKKYVDDREGVQTVTGYYVDNTDVKNPIVQRVSPLPKDFIVSVVFSSVAPEIEGSKLMYITDQNRYIALEPDIIPDMTGNGFSVQIIDDAIHFSYRLDLVGGVRQFGRGVLRGCRIVDNILTYDSSEYVLVPTADLPSTFSPENITLHAEGYSDGYLYDVTRVQTGATYILKTNASNLNDYKVTTPFNGGYIHNIEIYEDYIYFMYVDFSNTSIAHIGRIRTDFSEPYEQVFTINADPTRTAYAGFPFTIYRDKIYIPTVNLSDLTSLRNNIRIMVYDMNGKLLEESAELVLGNTGTSLRVFPHWMTIFNDKIFLHTAVSTSSVKKLIRIDLNTLTLDGANSVVDTACTAITDDNTITSDGRIYLNSESSTSSMQYLYLVPDYRDFSNIVTASDIGYRSTGTPANDVPKTSLKTKLSDFKNNLGSLPELPFVSCTYKGAPNYGRYLTYITDKVRELDLLPYMPVGTTNLYCAFGVIKSGDRLIIKVEKNDALGNWGLLALDITIIDNVYKVVSSQYKELPSILKDVNNSPYNLHSEAVIDKFLYLATRTTTSSTGSYEDFATQVFKVNTNNINDVTEYSLPVLRGAVGEMQAYKDRLYMITRKSASDGYMISIDKNLKDYKEHFTLGTVDATRRLPATPPFLIYQDKFYIPTLYNSSTPTNVSFNAIGMAVYSVNTGALIMENPNITISTGRTVGQGAAHWISMFNGKIILTAVSSSPTSDTRLVRINPDTLLLDGAVGTASITLPYKITNNNTISLDGWVYPNPEITFTAPLVRYKYNDFLSSETLISTGYYSAGSLEYPINPEGLRSRLSQFQNDGDGVSPFATQAFVGTKGLNDVTAVNPNTSQPINLQGVPAQFYSSGLLKGFIIGTGDRLGIYSNTEHLEIGSGTNKDIYLRPGGTGVVNSNRIINYDTDLSGSYTIRSLTDKNYVDTTRQATLVSGTNIKTINGISLLGSGDISVGGGGGGATNLTYTASPTNGIVVSDTGTDATIPLADTTNAGLLSPSGFTKLSNLSGTNTGDNVQATEGLLGIAQIATQTETNTGTNDTKFLTPLKAKTRNDATYVALTGDQTIAGNKTLSGTTTFSNNFTITGGLTTNYITGAGTVTSFTTGVRGVAVKSTALVANSAAPTNTDGLSNVGDKMLYLYNNKVDKIGTTDIEITDATKGIILKDAGDGSRRRLTVVNGVITVSAAL